MRASPLAVYSAYKNLPQKEILTLAECDTRMTHSNPIVIDAVGLYVVALADLIRGTPPDVVYKEHQARARESEVKDWQEMVDKGMKMEVTKNIGLAKIAWTWTFAWLRQFVEGKGIEYQEAIKGMVWEGGDTDTNACILGAMVGAVLGQERIPPEYIRILL